MHKGRIIAQATRPTTRSHSSKIFEVLLADGFGGEKGGGWRKDEQKGGGDVVETLVIREVGMEMHQLFQQGLKLLPELLTMCFIVVFDVDERSSHVLCDDQHLILSLYPANAYAHP
jgi:hypothetical protein